MAISLIVAVADNNAIGIDNKLPWAHITEDMQWFKKHSKDKVVVMGRNTWDSLPRKPLPNRTNVVLTSRDSIEGTDLIINLPPEEAIKELGNTFGDLEICIIGGAKVYNDFAKYATRLYVTRVHQVVPADTYLDVDLMLATLGGFSLEFSEFNQVAGATFQIWNKN